MSGYSKEELEMLTDEEREGYRLLTEDEAALTDGEPYKDTDGSEETAGEGETENKEDVSDKPETNAQPDNADAEPEPDEEKKPYIPVLPAYAAPADAEDRLETINNELKAVAEQYDEGDLTAKEMTERQMKLNADKKAIEDELFKARMAQEQRFDVWSNHVVPDFIEKHPQYKDNPTALHTLDNVVKQIQTYNPERIYDPKILDEAHKRIVGDLEKLLGVNPQTAAATPAPKRPMPPNLSHVPAAETTEPAEGGKFTHLDRLTGEAYEQAFARLSEAEQEDYLAGR